MKIFFLHKTKIRINSTIVRMAEKNWIAVIATPIIMIVAVMSLVNTGLLITSNKIVNLKIEISYSGPWVGVVYNNDNIQHISGLSKKTIIIVRPVGDTWGLSVLVEKKEDNMNHLVVRVMTIDGNVLAEGQTIQPYGKITISLDIN